MKNISFIFFAIICSTATTFGQDSIFIKINKWLTGSNFAVRQTFDGSKNENKPASILFQENHKSTSDFINVDLAVKLSEIELLKNSNSILIFYPKIEWHKSNDSTDIKNKIDGGVNLEYIPFGLEKLPLAPWFQGTSSFKRNFIDDVYETKLTFQLSFTSNRQFFPGANIRDNNDNFRARYYPYFGVEYNHLPDLITKGVTEEFSTYFIRLFAEFWVIPQTLQLNIDGTYREIINNNTSIKTSLPIFAGSIYLYPGKQESFGIGYEYKHGYDNNSKFKLIQISSLKLSWKI